MLAANQTKLLIAKQLYLEDNKTQSEIREIVGLSRSAVEKILELTQSVKTNVAEEMVRCTTFEREIRCGGG